jgi:hypothetical protein
MPKAFMLTALAALLATAAAQCFWEEGCMEVGCTDLILPFGSVTKLMNLAAYKTAVCGSSCQRNMLIRTTAAQREQYYCQCSSPAITYEDSMVGCELSPPTPSVITSPITSAASPPPPQCTIGGSAAAGTPCHFPFNYQGVHTGCTAASNNGVLWCSTTAEYEGQWGNCEDCPPLPPLPLPPPPPLPPTPPPPAVCEGALDATPFESAAWKTIFCGSDCDSLRASVAEVYMPSSWAYPEGALWVEQMQCQCANPDVPWMETVVCYPPVSDLLSEPVSNLKSMLPVSDLKQAAFSRAGVGVLGAAFVASIAIAAVVARRVRNASVAPPSLI